MAKFFLQKSGKSHGPFTAEQISEFRKSGEIFDYAWLWDETKPGWQAIDNPAPPGAVSATPEPAAEPHAPTRTTKAETPREAKGIEAVCHDYRQVVTGKLGRVTDSGCELVSDDGTSPSFREKSKVYLNLVDTRTGRTMDVQAQLSTVKREQGHWTYRLEWDNCPELLR